MSTASVTSQSLLTAEEFAALPDPGHPEELVRGKVVPMAMPKPRLGQICYKTARILGGRAPGHVSPRKQRRLSARLARRQLVEGNLL